MANAGLRFEDRLEGASNKMMLREKLRSTKMAKGDTVASYLTKFTQIRDELAAVGEVWMRLSW
jgi:hypothetical protein